MPFQVLASTSLLPMMLSAHTHHPSATMGLNTQLLGGGAAAAGGGGASKSPFRIVPIPSINRTKPEELPDVSC